MGKILSIIGVRIAVGVVATVTLMLVLTIAGINYMSRVNVRMKDVVENNNVKIEMAHILQNTIRERAINLYVIALVEDSFLKDEEYQRFNSFGLRYNTAYQTLESLASSPEEKSILQNIHGLTLNAQHDVQEVIELLLRDDARKHYDAIRKRVMPNQKMIKDQVIELVALQKIQAAEAAKEAELSYQYAWKLMLVLGIAASALVILIAGVVSRKVSKQAQDMEYQAFHDELTTLPNRMLFLDRLAHAITRSQREKIPFAIMLLDLDRFKEVNDTLGHNMGDQLLQQVSCRLNDTVRESDTVARLGGDEFVILMERIVLEHAPEKAEKIIKLLDRPFMLAGQLVDVSASIGIAYFPVHGDDSVSLLQKADLAMYAAKRNHSGFEIYSGALIQGSRADLAFRSELLQAIECDELVLYFQPKIDLHTRKVTSVEALVRWQHPQRGFLPPDIFIPQAEQTGLINQLTFWVLKKALEQCAEFNNTGIDITVAINLSAGSLNDLRMPGEIARMLANSRIKPSMLVIEITESAVMSDPVGALNVLKILDKMGVALTIDDFGTGYSSLAYLSKLPVDEIKIDKSFVLEMVQDQQAAVIVRSTIDLGHNLAKKVVAEGVETLELWNLLSEWGCDTAQGYYMSKPMPADKLMKWLRESRWA
ncbi:MAG TPA: EAL domain-containing protein [Gallionellaceae bacterium]|nr:EAL domain-containing protein [Gallionellaceae bacterium]